MQSSQKSLGTSPSKTGISLIQNSKQDQVNPFEKQKVVQQQQQPKYQQQQQPYNASPFKSQSHSPGCISPFQSYLHQESTIKTPAYLSYNISPKTVVDQNQNTTQYQKNQQSQFYQNPEPSQFWSQNQQQQQQQQQQMMLNRKRVNGNYQQYQNIQNSTNRKCNSADKYCNTSEFSSLSQYPSISINQQKQEYFKSTKNSNTQNKCLADEKQKLSSYAHPPNASIKAVNFQQHFNDNNPINHIEKFLKEEIPQFKSQQQQFHQNLQMRNNRHNTDFSENLLPNQNYYYTPHLNHQQRSIFQNQFISNQRSHSVPSYPQAYYSPNCQNIKIEPLKMSQKNSISVHSETRTQSPQIVTSKSPPTNILATIREIEKRKQQFISDSARLQSTLTQNFIDNKENNFSSQQEQNTAGTGFTVKSILKSRDSSSSKVQDNLYVDLYRKQLQNMQNQNQQQSVVVQNQKEIQQQIEYYKQKAKDQSELNSLQLQQQQDGSSFSFYKKQNASNQSHNFSYSQQSSLQQKQEYFNKTPQIQSQSCKNQVSQSQIKQESKSNSIFSKDSSDYQQNQGLQYFKAPVDFIKSPSKTQISTPSQSQHNKNSSQQQQRDISGILSGCSKKFESKVKTSPQQLNTNESIANLESHGYISLQTANMINSQMMKSSNLKEKCDFLNREVGKCLTRSSRISSLRQSQFDYEYNNNNNNKHQQQQQLQESMSFHQQQQTWPQEQENVDNKMERSTTLKKSILSFQQNLKTNNNRSDENKDIVPISITNQQSVFQISQEHQNQDDNSIVQKQQNEEFREQQNNQKMNILQNQHSHETLQIISNEVSKKLQVILQQQQEQEKQENQQKLQQSVNKDLKIVLQENQNLRSENQKLNHDLKLCREQQQSAINNIELMQDEIMKLINQNMKYQQKEQLYEVDKKNLFRSQEKLVFWGKHRFNLYHKFLKQVPLEKNLDKQLKKQVQELEKGKSQQVSHQQQKQVLKLIREVEKKVADLEKKQEKKQLVNEIKKKMEEKEPQSQSNQNSGQESFHSQGVEQHQQNNEQNPVLVTNPSSCVVGNVSNIQKNMSGYQLFSSNSADKVEFMEYLKQKNINQQFNPQSHFSFQNICNNSQPINGNVYNFKLSDVQKNQNNNIEDKKDLQRQGQNIQKYNRQNSGEFQHQLNLLENLNMKIQLSQTENEKSDQNNNQIRQRSQTGHLWQDVVQSDQNQNADYSQMFTNIKLPSYQNFHNKLNNSKQSEDSKEMNVQINNVPKSGENLISIGSLKYVKTMSNENASNIEVSNSHTNYSHNYLPFNGTQKYQNRQSDYLNQNTQNQTACFSQPSDNSSVLREGKINKIQNPLIQNSEQSE